MGARNSSSNNNRSRHVCRPRRKIAILGDCGTGKTSLMTRFVMDMFNERQVANTDVVFDIKRLQLDGRDIKVTIMDTYTFRDGIPSLWLWGCTGVVVVYDVTNQESFNKLENFLEHIDDTRGEYIVDKLIIGNKCDLTTQRVVEYTTAKEFSDKHGIPLVEASAKTGINVDQAFLRLLVAIMKRTSEPILGSINRT